MAPVNRGSEILLRWKKTANIEAAVAGAYQSLNFYNENAQPGEGLEDDDMLGGSDRHNGIDPTQQAESLPNPTFSMQVPLDLNQIGVYLGLMFGWPTTEDADDPVFEHVFTSGLAAPGLAHFEIPTTTNLVKFASSQCVQSMTIPVAPTGGFRKVDLTLLGRSVHRNTAAVSTSVVAAPAEARIPGYGGIVKIDGVEFDNVLDGQLVLSNGAIAERYAKNTKWMSAVEVGKGSATFNPRIRTRTDIATVLNKFDGVTPFTLEYVLALSADLSLSFYFPNAVAPKVMPSGNQGVGMMDIQPNIMCSQKKGGSPAPMCTVTLRNAVEAY